MAKYQTISEFLAAPFGNKSNETKLAEYNEKYSKFITTNKIFVNKVTIIEGSYYFHIKVPSESQNKVNYDVVIRFFTNDASVAAEKTLQNYHIQFFSNSPSFIYQYAYVYKENGYLIKSMYDKLDQKYIDVPPEKTNKNLEIGFDKSIYFACKCLRDKGTSMLTKNGSGIFMKRVYPNQFFRGITDVETLRMDQLLLSEEKKLNENMKVAKRDSKENRESHKEPKQNAETSGKTIKPNAKIAPKTKTAKVIKPKKKI